MLKITNIKFTTSYKQKLVINKKKKLPCFQSKFSFYISCSTFAQLGSIPAPVRLNKQRKNSMSHTSSLRQIGRPDLNAVVFFFFFFFFFFLMSSRRVKFESVTTLFSMKYGTWFLDEQDTRQNTELKKSVVQSVLLCLSCLFMYILTSKFIKKLKKNWNNFRIDHGP